MLKLQTESLDNEFVILEIKEVGFLLAQNIQAMHDNLDAIPNSESKLENHSW